MADLIRVHRHHPSPIKSQPDLLRSPATHLTATRLKHLTTLDIYNEPHVHRKSSIICTIGPGTNNVESLRALANEGMNIVRMNFSHGDYDFHGSIIDNTREAEKTLGNGRVLAIALDTKGPEIRTGLLKDGKDIFLEKGVTLTLSTDPARERDGDAETIYVDYKNLPVVVAVGSYIYVDDGLISLCVLEKGDDWVKTTVVNSGALGSRKGVNLPNANVDLPAISEKDKRDLRFGVEKGVDMIFASFIRKASDIEHIRQVLGEEGRGIRIIAKIENHEGMRNFDEILQVTDGVMVARGDLGIEIDAQKVFLAQKMMIAKCNIVGKPVICATQMLESMTFNPRPTRAEVSDVANAVLDGSDCVMLSGETAKGKYPLECVRMMANICREAEGATFYGRHFTELQAETPRPLSTTETVASSAVVASLENAASAIIVLTTTGTSARLVAKYRPACPILAVTRCAHTARVCHLYRGCYPIVFDQPEPVSPTADEWQRDVDARIEAAIEWGRQCGVVDSGNTVLAIQGWRGGPGHTNCMRLIIVP